MKADTLLVPKSPHVSSINLCVQPKAFSHCVCVHACVPERLKRIQNSQVHNIPNAYCPAGRVATGGNKGIASSERFHTHPSGQEPGESHNGDFLSSKHMLLTSCGLCVLTPFFLSHSERFPLNHNNPKSAKTYQSLGKPCLQRASRLAFMALSNSS